MEFAAAGKCLPAGHPPTKILTSHHPCPKRIPSPGRFESQNDWGIRRNGTLAHSTDRFLGLKLAMPHDKLTLAF